MIRFYALLSDIFSPGINMSGCFGRLLTYENEQKPFFFGEVFQMVISSFVSANTDFTEYRKVTLTDKFSTCKFCSVNTSSLIQPAGRIC